MKKIFFFAVLMGLLAVNSGLVGATVLNFDDLALNGTYGPMSNLNYGGFDWDSRWYAGDNTNGTYNNGAHSGTQYLSNGWAVNDLLVSQASPFDFNGAWFAHPDRNFNIATQIQLFGLASDNSILYQTGLVDINDTHQYIAANFGGVNKIRIWHNNGNAGWFVMDDFEYNEPIGQQPVPEPGTLMLLGTGLLGLVGLRKKSKN